MKVYLAARFSRLPELNRYRAELEAAGITVTSRWLLGGHEWVGTPDEQIPRERLARFAAEDLEDIDAADVLLCFTESPRSGPARGGRHVEFGYALAKRKPVIVVGHIENVFYALPQVTHCETRAEALQLLWNAEWVPNLAIPRQLVERTKGGAA
jgi:nucleoside 2-deoxyribosyltransferase